MGKIVSHIASKTHPNFQQCRRKFLIASYSSRSLCNLVLIPSNERSAGDGVCFQIIPKFLDHFSAINALPSTRTLHYTGGSRTNGRQGESPGVRRGRRQRTQAAGSRKQQSASHESVSVNQNEHEQFYETYRIENDIDDNMKKVDQQGKTHHDEFYATYQEDDSDKNESSFGDDYDLENRKRVGKEILASLLPESGVKSASSHQSYPHQHSRKLNPEKATRNQITRDSKEDGRWVRSDSEVHIVGDTRRANDTYRKRSEKKALTEDADPSSAATVAVRIRRQLKEEAKMKRGGTSPSETNSNNEDDPHSKPKSKDMRHQIQDLSKLQASTVANVLRKCVIYNKDDIVAIDKPYGLPSHGGPGITHSIDGLLPMLARNLAKPSEDNPTLHLVHRLDKETTGVMLLAKSEETLRRLQAMFRERKVVKKYWVITAGVPDPPRGVIDMPMAEAEIGNRYRMVVRPDLTGLYPDLQTKTKRRRPSSGTDAVTEFSVLDSSKKCALVELKALTGIKHQIRVHLAQGMACPILGDHKYSHYSKQAPQRLHISTLERLGITQQKVRTVPMHLHAQMVTLPEFLEEGKKSLSISTKLPRFFAYNMKKLKLRVPSHV